MFKPNLALKIIIFVIIIFAIFAYLSLRADRKELMAESERMAELLSMAIYIGLSEAMLEGETHKVQKIVESYGSVDKIDRITIFDPEYGSILVDADRNNIGATIDQRYISLLENSGESPLFLQDGKQILSMVLPIVNEPRCYQCHDSQESTLGALNVDVSIADMFGDLARVRSRTVQLVLLAIIAVSLAIIVIVIYSVNRPLRELITTMSRIELGDLSARAHVTGSSELAKLSKSLNSMISKLHQDIGRLEALRKTAEDFRSTIDLEEIKRIAVQGISKGLGFERVVLLLVNQEEQILEGGVGIGVVKDILENIRIPLDREYGILAETVLDAKPLSINSGVYDVSLMPETAVKCWEALQCEHYDCPAYEGGDLRCWLQSETHCHCHDTLQQDFEDTAERCCRCSVIKQAYGKKALLALLMFGSNAFVTVPLMVQNEATGVIMVDNLESGRPITDEDIKGLSIFATQTGMAIENAKLYRRLEDRVEVANAELEQKIAALTEMTNLNASILQNMSNVLITIDNEGNIAYFNRAAEIILDYKAQEVQGKCLESLFSELWSLASETLQQRVPLMFHEINIPTRTGDNIPAEVFTSLLKNDYNEITGVVLILTDLTERKEMENQMRRADKLVTLGQLAAGIAHEIRNPLAGISGAVQILKDDIPENVQSREILDDIIERINMLNAAISDFLRFARPTPLQLSPTDINEVVQSVLFLINRQAETQGVRIVEEYASNLPIVMADSEQIQQVILNIALNALQATGQDGGEITFRIFQNDYASEAVTEISDTGIGIPFADLDKIFNPYFTTKAEGTGLGLSIAQRIIEEHGGRISVESEIGKGTVFRISLNYD